MDSNTLIIVISILFSAFFAGIEIAFISANKLLIELKNKQGSLYASILSMFVANPSKFISTTLVGNNIGLVVYGIYMAKFLEPFLDGLSPVLHNNHFLLTISQTILSTVLVLITAEFIPKVLFRINPDNMLRALAVPFLLFYYLFYPLVHFINWLAKIILNSVLKVAFAENTPVFSKVDLDQYISQIGEQDIPDDAEVDTEIFKNALDFTNTKVRDCMTPRAELVAVNQHIPIDELYQKFIETGLSKILVYEQNPDHIIGYVHQKEIFHKPDRLDAILIPIVIATETMPIMDLLNKFSRTRKSMALVVDELGGTAGIVTLEDIMEEIFGEIEDEHDVEELVEEQLSDNEFLLSARHEVYYLNETYNLHIPEGDYHTIGGYIFNRHESFPEAGETLLMDQFEIVIESVSNAKIETIRLKVLEVK